MKKIYEIPTLDVVKFGLNDVIVTSQGLGEEDDGTGKDYDVEDLLKGGF